MLKPTAKIILAGAIVLGTVLMFVVLGQIRKGGQELAETAKPIPAAPAGQITITIPEPGFVPFNTLTIKGTLSAGSDENVENYFLQECYWGEFSRSIVLPVPVKEEEIEAVLKDGVLTVSFAKVKQDTVKKIEVL